MAIHDFSGVVIEASCDVCTGKMFIELEKPRMPFLSDGVSVKGASVGYHAYVSGKYGGKNFMHVCPSCQYHIKRGFERVISELLPKGDVDVAMDRG